MTKKLLKKEKKERRMKKWLKWAILRVRFSLIMESVRYIKSRWRLFHYLFPWWVVRLFNKISVKVQVAVEVEFGNRVGWAVLPWVLINVAPLSPILDFQPQGKSGSMQDGPRSGIIS